MLRLVCAAGANCLHTATKFEKSQLKGVKWNVSVDLRACWVIRVAVVQVVVAVVECGTASCQLRLRRLQVSPCFFDMLRMHN